MTEKEKMLAGKLYLARDAELREDHHRALHLTRLFNQTTEKETTERANLLKQLFKSAGKNITVEPTFRCDYGYNISVGDNFFANYDCIILDICEVSIGDNVLFAPRVCLYTAAHPLDAEVRRTELEYGKPITIGNDVWIGGNCVINPGINIGNDVVIGSGSVVTRNIPSGVVAAGNPCKILRSVTEEDRAYWQDMQYPTGSASQPPNLLKPTRS